ncbi:MAG: OmpA family protein [Cyclobacteriaceae bacterium]
MKKYIYLVTCLLIYHVQAQESVVWANEVVEVSSEFSHLEFSALQALHKPNVHPNGGENPNAWRPKNENKSDQFIMVSFDTPIKAKQVAIAETENPGAVTRIVAFDKDYQEHVLFEVTPRVIPLESRLLNLFFEETTYEIHALSVELDPSAVSGYPAIDAIGISASNIPVNVLIQLTSGVSQNVEAEALSANVNSSYVEHSPIISPDGKRLYFSRKYHPENSGGIDDPEDIWMSELDEATGEWLPARNIGEPLNTPGPNFISSIASVDGKDQFVLGNRYGKKGRMYAGTSVAYMEPNGEYGKPESVEIENEYNYSNKADFFLVPGGEVLIQSVERDDSYGGRDLYVSFKNGNGWSEPKNMGGDVNTISEDAAPFLAADGKTLYYSTGGLQTFGGMDIFVSRRLDDSWEKWSPPDNLGKGVNTAQDDLYFSIPSSGQHLYFTRGDTGDDTDIFRFKVDDFFIDPDDPIASSVSHMRPDEPEVVLVAVTGKVIDNKTGEPMAGVDVIVERLPDGIKLGSTRSKEDGSYTFSLRPGAMFGISAEKDGFLAVNENLDLNDTKKSESISMDLKLAQIEVGGPIVMNNIFFAFNKAELRTASYSELERILKYILDGTIKKIEISGHTDSIGSEEVNLRMSQRRANSVMEYFVNNGVDRSVIDAKGYGESQPIDTNETKEGQQNNRRVEFKVLDAG